MKELSTEIKYALNTIIEGLNYNFLVDDNGEILDIEKYASSLDAGKMKIITQSKLSSFNSAKSILDRWIDSPNAPSKDTIRAYISKLIYGGENAVEILRKSLAGEINYDIIDYNKHDAAIKAKPFILETILELDSSIIELRNKLSSDDFSLKDRDFELGYPERFAKGEFYPESDYWKDVLKGDAIKICPFGTEGEKITLDDLDIILPKVPSDKSLILFNDLPKKEQYWRRPIHPNITPDNIDMYHDYIMEEYRRRREGVWFMNNGKPVYLTGNHYFAMTHAKMLDDGDYMKFRYAQLEMFYHAEACIRDYRALGQLFGKSRRTGFTYMAIFILLNMATAKRNGKFGLMSKTGTDGQEAFSKISYAFLNLPFWLRPVVRSKLDSPYELFFGAPLDNSKKAKKTKVLNVDEYLNTSFDWRNTKNGSYDSIKLNGYLFDECYSPNTKILTPNGFKFISDINVGDYVVNGFGDKKKVLDKREGSSQMYKVVQPYGKDYFVTENHKLYLNYGTDIKYSRNVFISPSEYFKDIPKHRRRYFRRTVFNGFEYSTKKLKIDPYFLGVWLGDGLSDEAAIVVNPEDDAELYEYLISFIKVNGFNYNERVRDNKCSVIYILDNTIGANQWTGILHRLKKELNNYNLLKNKHIPNIYFKSSRKQRLELLAGIIDTDGHKVRNNSYSIGMSRLNLIQDIYKLSKELGLDTSEISRKKSNFDTDVFIVRITDYDGEIPCKVERKKPIITKKVNRRGRVYIEPYEYGDFVGITIDGISDEERLLVLEDYTLSKNCGKVEAPNDAIVHMATVTPTMMPSGKVVGKMFAGSTMGAHSKGGAQFIELIKGSKVKDRNQITGKTATGLYFYFLPAHKNMEEFTDIYGYCHTEKPKTKTYNILGNEIKIGSLEYLLEVEKQKKLQGDKAYNEQLRTYPRKLEHMMRDESSECIYNMTKIYEQLDYNETLLENDKYTIGNFDWKDEEDGDVIFIPNPNGRFKISWLPSKVDNTEKLANNVKKINDNYYPLNGEVIRFGCDPFTLKSTHGVGSKGGLHGLTMMLPDGGAPSNKFAVEYLARPSDEIIFFEDVIKCVHYYGAPILVESNRIDLLRHMRNRGYRGFAMDRLDRPKNKLNPNEKEYGGQPMSGKDIIDSHSNAVGSWIERYIGKSTNEEFRQIGTMGDMPFDDTLKDWLNFDPDNRTKYDATISSGLAIMACNKEKYKGKIKERKVVDLSTLLPRYKNSHDVSTLISN